MNPKEYYEYGTRLFEARNYFAGLFAKGINPNGKKVEEQGVAELKASFMRNYESLLREEGLRILRRKFAEKFTTNSVRDCVRGTLSISYGDDTARYQLLLTLAKKHNPEWVDFFEKDYERKLKKKKNR